MDKAQSEYQGLTALDGCAVGKYDSISAFVLTPERSHQEGRSACTETPPIYRYVEKCALCGADTEMFVSNIPICPGCSAERDQKIKDGLPLEKAIKPAPQN
jgi:hypothetical protein